MNSHGKSIFFFIFFIVCWLSALTNTLQDSAILTLQRGNDAYQSNNYEDAITFYENVLDLQFESATLYYNLGNAHYKNGNNARALLWYERALRLDTKNEDIKHNISFVQQKLIDKIELLPELFIVKWWNTGAKLFTGNQWSIISIVACSFFALCILIILLIRVFWVRSFTTFILIIALLVTVFSIIFAKQETKRYNQNPEGIIMSSVLNVKSTPSEKGSDLFVIHSGLKVGITDQLNEWVEIRLPNGEKGWVLAGNVEII
ncbi:MAG: tetratricopeptide repeat protein [Bacteroidales bacterium]|jgi:tetratricopeptide (TPR) repeat protein|nr:tetratricopeptide repeat protein [Bacteroidales bacterium]